MQLQQILLCLPAVAAAPLDTLPCSGSMSFLGQHRTTLATSQDHSSRLTLCRRHERNSCCTPDMTESLRLALRPPAKRQISQTLYGLETNAQEHWQRGLSVGCQIATEESVCSVCDAVAGRAPLSFVKDEKEIKETRADKGVPICEQTCRAWYQSCLESLFVVDPKTQRLVPCQSDDPLVCWKARHIDNYTAFCAGFGLAVVEESDSNSYCYDGAMIGAQILGSGPKPPPAKRRLSIQERALMFADFALASLESLWRGVSGMVIWIFIFGLLWVISHTNRLNASDAAQVYVENPGWSE